MGGLTRRVGLGRNGLCTGAAGVGCRVLVLSRTISSCLSLSIYNLYIAQVSRGVMQSTKLRWGRTRTPVGRGKKLKGVSRGLAQGRNGRCTAGRRGSSRVLVLSRTRSSCLSTLYRPIMAKVSARGVIWPLQGILLPGVVCVHENQSAFHFFCLYGPGGAG